MRRPQDEPVYQPEYSDEELQTEAENRIRNLMWTVSGDYTLDTKLEAGLYFRSKYAAMYDAVKQGAFARYLDRNAFSMYLVKKIYYGAEERPLTELAQLCVDAAVFRKAQEERPGVAELRDRAFSDLLDKSFGKMSASLTGRLKIALLRGYLMKDWHCERTMSDAVERIRALEDGADTKAVIEAVDALYNTLIDKSFVRRHGDLAHVLAATLEDLQEFDWRDYLEEESVGDFLEKYLQRINSRVVHLEEEQDEEEQPKHGRGRKVVVIDEKSAAKMYSYMELNYGRSYLGSREQKNIDLRLCRGAHADCSLYFTDGILANPVRVNAQYVNAKRHAEKNRRFYMNNKNMLRRNIDLLTGELKRSLVRREEPEQFAAQTGTLVVNRLWKVGRTEDAGKLFEKTLRRNGSDFVVDILMDASGSQRDRQSQVALQAYMISEALSNNAVPHRITSFCSFWDYTVLQRFREYDAPRSENKRIFDYTTSSNNRDGLAVRAVGDSLLQRPEEGKILIVLSDGKPNDIIVNRPNSRNPQPYYGEYAVRDTAYEVRKLRGLGVCVLGVFTGKEKELAAEKRIFGKDFAYIRNIENFSRVVGRYLRKLLEEQEKF